MKKIIFAFAILLLAIPSSAQFKATKDGFLAEDGKNFYVAVVEGKSAMDLYKGVNAYIISNFKNPDAVANRMDGEMINMHASIDNAFVCKKMMGVKHYMDLDMNIVIHFKDGKIRFDAPVMNKMRCPTASTGIGTNGTDYYFSGGVGKFVSSVSLFGDDGKIKNKKVVNSLTEFINSYINSIIDSAKNYSTEDW